MTRSPFLKWGPPQPPFLPARLVDGGLGDVARPRLLAARKHHLSGDNVILITSYVGSRLWVAGGWGGDGKTGKCWLCM